MIQTRCRARRGVLFGWWGGVEAAMAWCGGGASSDVEQGRRRTWGGAGASRHWCLAGMLVKVARSLGGTWWRRCAAAAATGRGWTTGTSNKEPGTSATSYKLLQHHDVRAWMMLANAAKNEMRVVVAKLLGVVGQHQPHARASWASTPSARLSHARRSRWAATAAGHVGSQLALAKLHLRGTASRGVGCLCTPQHHVHAH